MIDTEELKRLKDPVYYIEKYLRVLTKADEHGESKLIPMLLLLTQRDYISNRTHRDIVLKGRQMGLSTGIMAANSHLCFTRPYMKMSIVTHNQDTSEFLLQTIHRFHRNLPEGIRPKAGWKSSSRLWLPAMDSIIHIDSAEASSIGFGETLNIAHLSEMSRWNLRTAEELFAGITQTVPAGGYITIESTPRGRHGLFYDFYTSAKRGDVNYKTFFYPWWFDLNYNREVKNPLEFSNEEKQLVNFYHLTPGQIAFRREKISELKDLFFQEYPENDVDCWLSSDIGVFDAVTIRDYLLRAENGREDGNITTWRDVMGGEKYVIGVDCAAGLAKGDYSVAAVINVRRCEYVARLRGRTHPDLFSQELMRLAHHYNDALIGVEREAHGHMVLRTLLEANYPEIYYHEDYDSVLKETTFQPGWKTTLKSKPIMVDTMKAFLRARALDSWSRNLMDEAASYIWENENRSGHGSGKHDDELDAVMIALQLREQTPVLEPTVRNKPVVYARL